MQFVYLVIMNGNFLLSVIICHLCVVDKEVTNGNLTIINGNLSVE